MVNDDLPFALYEEEPFFGISVGKGCHLLTILKTAKARFDEALRHRRLPTEAKDEVRRDRRGLAAEDLGTEKSIEATLNWLCRAQDMSRSADGGVARVYNLINGWSTSYPETTGYIIPTILECAKRTGSQELTYRAQRMLEWLKQIQMPSGAFQGGKIDSSPKVPVAFNTGQILIGLASGEESFGNCRESMVRAADWLVEIQDSDGCWRKHASPFARKGEKTYDTHTAWGLLQAARIEPNRGYAEAALANVRWALSHQKENGWIEKCALGDPAKLLTHTLGYSLRGILEAFRFSRDDRFLKAARITTESLLAALRNDGFLPGLFWPDWSPAAKWACVTGTSQLAICWFMLYQETGYAPYHDAACRANSFARRTIRFDGPADITGGVRGSFPINGGYSSYEYPSWAAKFLIDSLHMEEDIAAGASPGSASQLVELDKQQT